MLMTALKIVLTIAGAIGAVFLVAAADHIPDWLSAGIRHIVKTIQHMEKHLEKHLLVRHLHVKRT